MKAEEKAIELFDRFSLPTDPLNKYPMCFDTAKDCALICVDEQIDYIRNFTPLSWQVREAMTNELEEVKQEINKL